MIEESKAEEFDGKKLEDWKQEKENLNVSGRNDVVSCLDSAETIIESLKAKYEILEDSYKVFRVYLDGDALCIVHENFVDLQESNSFFVKLTEKEEEKWKEFSKK